MQEEKKFGCQLFGFNREDVLNYLYEQDELTRKYQLELQKRSEEISRKNSELVDQLKNASEELAVLCTDKDSLLESNRLLTDDMKALKDKYSVLIIKYKEKENSLLLQLDINRQQSKKIKEQDEELEILRNSLQESKARLDSNNLHEEQITTIKNELEKLKEDFSNRIHYFEIEISKICPTMDFSDFDKMSAVYDASSDISVKKVVTVKTTKPGILNAAAVNAKSKLNKVIKEWK